MDNGNPFNFVWLNRTDQRICCLYDVVQGIYRMVGKVGKEGKATFTAMNYYYRSHLWLVCAV